MCSFPVSPCGGCYQLHYQSPDWRSPQPLQTPASHLSGCLKMLPAHDPPSSKLPTHTLQKDLGLGHKFAHSPLTRFWSFTRGSTSMSLTKTATQHANYE